MREGGPQAVSQAGQHRVLRQLFLRLFFRGRARGDRSKGQLRTDTRVRMAVLLFTYGLVGAAGLSTWWLGVFERSATLHALTFLMLGMLFASFSGTLLFNAEEADILLHRPVTARALLAAKVWVLVVLGVMFAGALNAAGMAVGVFGPHGTWLFLPAHALALVLEVVFAGSMVTLAYGLCLRWFGREKLDNFITTAQVLVAVGVMVGAQLMPRLLGHVDTGALHRASPWLALLPPAWFGGLVAALTGAEVTPRTLVLSGLAVIATAGTAWLALGRLAASYGEGLMALNEAGPAATRPQGAHGRAIRRLLTVPVIRWWLRDPVEQAAFRLTAAGLTRARDVKLRVYPQLAQLCVYPLIFLLGGGRGPMAHEAVGTFGIAFAGAMSATMGFNTLEILRFSDHWQAAELFRLAPLASPAALFHGARKAVLLLLGGPIALALIALLLAWRGFSGSVTLLAPGLVAMPLFAMLPGLGQTLIPFSEPPDHARNMSGGCLRVLIVMAGAGSIAGLTSAAVAGGWLGWLLAIELPIVAALTVGLRVWIDRKPWPAGDD